MTDEFPIDAPADPPAGAPARLSAPPSAMPTALPHEEAADEPARSLPSPDAPTWPAPMPRPRGAARDAGLVAAAATAGALVAFGLRDDANLAAPFTAAGRLLLGIAPTEGVAASILAALAGLALHVSVCLGWGTLFALLASRRGPWRLAVTAALLGVAVYSATTLWLPAALQLGFAVRTTRPQLILLHVLFSAGLWVGTRIAQLGSRDA